MGRAVVSGVAGDVPRSSFAAFRAEFFGLETYVHQAQLVDALERVGPREIVLVNIWPESGKSTTVEDWICQQLAYDPNLRITAVSESSSLTTKMVGHVQMRMRETAQFGPFIETFGPFHVDGQERRNKPWAQDYFTVWKSNHDERDYSFAARAISSKVYGTRMDMLIVDDVQSNETLNQTDSIYRSLRQTYFTRGRQMRTVIVGTRIAPGDIYERLIDDGLATKEITLPAVTADGRITCPDMWAPDPRDSYVSDDEFLAAAQKSVDEQRRIVGEPVWFASYQQEPMSAAVSTFTEEMIDASKDSLMRVGEMVPGEDVVLSLDPALGGGNALMCAGRGLAGKHAFRVIDLRIDYNLGDYEQIFAVINEFASKYHPSLLIIENNAFQKGILNHRTLNELGAKHGFRVLPHTTTGDKADQMIGVPGMAGAFLRDEIVIPWGDEFSRERMAPLVRQLRSWRADIKARVLRQDAVMAMWFNWQQWDLNNRVMAANAGDQFRRHSMPYRPTPFRPLVFR